MKVKTRFKNMDIFLVFLLPLALLLVAWPQNLSARQDEKTRRRPRRVNNTFRRLPSNCSSW